MPNQLCVHIHVDLEDKGEKKKKESQESIRREESQTELSSSSKWVKEVKSQSPFSFALFCLMVDAIKLQEGQSYIKCSYANCYQFSFH